MKIWLLLIRDDTKTSLMQSVSSISESSAIFTQMHYSWMQFEESIHQHFRPDIGAEVLINFRLDFFNRCPMSEFKQVLLFNFSSIWLDWFLFGFLETTQILILLPFLVSWELPLECCCCWNGCCWQHSLGIR